MTDVPGAPDAPGPLGGPTPLDHLIGRLGTLPVGSVVALTVFGPGDRTVTVRSDGGSASVVRAAEHRPAAVLSFHVDTLAAMAADPAQVDQLVAAGRLHRRGDAAIAQAAIDALAGR
jgi:hypothetical protein